MATPPAPPAAPIPLFGPTGLKGKLPNYLTGMRLLFAAAFFAQLVLFDAGATDATRWALPVALVLFVVAAATDFLDGYLARKWNAVSVFGRVMDPFADKILVLGAFVMLAGPNFHLPSGAMLSGVAPWMVVVIIARELLITSLRGLCESRNVDFAAAQAGKIKMVVQSLSVPAILLLAWLATDNPDLAPGDPLLRTAYWVALGTSVITAVSAGPYLTRGFRGLRMQGQSP